MHSSLVGTLSTDDQLRRCSFSVTWGVSWTLMAPITQDISRLWVGMARVPWPGLTWAQALFGRGNPMATSNLKLLLEHKASPWPGGNRFQIGWKKVESEPPQEFSKCIQMWCMILPLKWKDVEPFRRWLRETQQPEAFELRWGSTPVVTILGSEVAKKSAMGFSNGSCLGISRYFPMVLRPWWTAGRSPVDKWQRSAC